MSGERFGILGGTFDPVHYGHLAIAEEVYAALRLTRVLFVPAGQPPHKPERSITPVRHRLAMLKLALAGNPHFALSLVDVQRAGPSYTVETLRLLHQELGAEAELYFVIGADSLKDLPEWYDPGGILEQAMVVALPRPGYPEFSRELLARLEGRLPTLKGRLMTLDSLHLDISSTDLRRRVAEGRPIAYQVPESVEAYIHRHSLYHGAGRRNGPAQEQMHVTYRI